MRTTAPPLLVLVLLPPFVGLACSEEEGLGGPGGFAASTTTAGQGGAAGTMMGGSGGSGGSGRGGTAGATSTSGGGAGGGGGADPSCNGSICHQDQSCQPTGCTFPCTGVTIPTDYATIQAAVDAFASNDQPVTICLGPGSYLGPQINLQGDVTIIGASRESVSLSAVVVRDRATIRGVTATAMFVGTGYPGWLTLESSSVEYLTLARGTLEVDGCEIDPSGGTAISASVHANSLLVVENSFLHGPNLGISAALELAKGADTYTVRLRNNTLVGFGTAIALSRDHLSLTLNATVTNNVITGAGTALQFVSVTPTSYANNALYGNGTNYAGDAVPCPGAVTTDPLLDGSSPPVPLPGSPLIDAGDADAPDHDFWGAPRTPSVDIGAVEAP